MGREFYCVLGGLPFGLERKMWGGKKDEEGEA